MSSFASPESNKDSDEKRSSQRSQKGVNRRSFLHTAGAIVGMAGVNPSTMLKTVSTSSVARNFLAQRLPYIGTGSLYDAIHTLQYIRVSDCSPRCDDLWKGRYEGSINVENFFDQLSGSISDLCCDICLKQQALQMLQEHDLSPYVNFLKSHNWDKHNDKYHYTKRVLAYKTVSGIFAQHQDMDAKLRGLSAHLNIWKYCFSSETDIQSDIPYLLYQFRYDPSVSSAEVVSDMIKRLRNGSNSWLTKYLIHNAVVFLRPENEVFNRSPVSDLFADSDYVKSYRDYLAAERSREEIVDVFRENTAMHPSLLSCILPSDRVVRERSSNWPWLPERLNDQFRITIDTDPDELPKIAEQCLRSIKGYYMNLPAGYPMSQLMRTEVSKQLPAFLDHAISQTMQQYFPDYWKVKQDGMQKREKRREERLSKKSNLKIIEAGLPRWPGFDGPGNDVY